jgi:hypothetical protein
MNENKSNNWRELLPRGIAAEIKTELALSISVRQINRILKAGVADEYGIVEYSIELTRKKIRENAALKQAARRLKTLTTKTK